MGFIGPWSLSRVIVGVLVFGDTAPFAYVSSVMGRLSCLIDVLTVLLMWSGLPIRCARASLHSAWVWTGGFRWHTGWEEGIRSSFDVVMRARRVAR